MLASQEKPFIVTAIGENESAASLFFPIQIISLIRGPIGILEFSLAMHDPIIPITLIRQLVGIGWECDFALAAWDQPVGVNMAYIWNVLPSYFLPSLYVIMAAPLLKSSISIFEILGSEVNVSTPFLGFDSSHSPANRYFCFKLSMVPLP